MSSIPPHSTPFATVRFGLNYTPSSGWWYCWNAFQGDAVARDLDAIAALGADHLRVMLLWPYFQPNPRHVSGEHLDRLDVLMRLAAERGLDVCATMLTGWLSGWAFRPVYDEPEAFFTSPRLRAATELYFRSCAARLNGHPNFLGFDLGNELNCCWKTDDLDAGDAWMARMFSLCEEASPGRVHVNGVDHLPWFAPATFSARALATAARLVAIHSWIGFTGATRRSGALERPCTHLSAAMAALVRAYSGRADTPVWLQEFGATAEWMDEADIPAFLERSVAAALDGGICWLTWWASHDVSRRFQFDSLEYELGLLTVDNRPKPAGLAFQRLAREHRGRRVVLPAGAPKAPPANPGLETTWEWLLDHMGEGVAAK